MFKVIVDDEVFENVKGWHTPGGQLIVIDFADGSTRGISGFVEFVVERVKDV